MTLMELQTWLRLCAGNSVVDEFMTRLQRFWSHPFYKLCGVFTAVNYALLTSEKPLLSMDGLIDVEITEV